MPTSLLAWARRLARRFLAHRFDYRDLYARADLDRDHWSIVGPSSRAEHEAMGRGKLQGLIDQGLTATSRVLDVGCGTGQLTGPLAEYLSPEGLYYGTDIAPEAVAFCRRRFDRPNFHFVQNEMTRLPIEGLTFDVVFLGSVFTHLYPEEVGGLLGEVKRLLAPAGVAVADAFVMEGSGHRGHRGQVRIGGETLRGLFDAVGLRAEEWFATPGRACRRVMYRLVHRDR